MRCRAATEADIGWLAAIAVAAYRATFVPLLPLLDWQSRDEAFFRARFAQEWQRMRIIEANGVARGFHLMTGGHIDMFFVAPGHTGQGIGAALLADADVQGAETLECFAANAGARRFYERHGWQVEAAYSREFLGQVCDFVRYRRSELAALEQTERLP